MEVRLFPREGSQTLGSRFLNTIAPFTKTLNQVYYLNYHLNW